MAKKTPSAALEAADDALVAAQDIAIEGRHFAAGTPVTDVDSEQLRIAVGAGRVITAAQFSGAQEPAPEPAPEGVASGGGAEPAADSTGDAAQA